MAHATPYDRDLDRNAANFQPLTPLTFLERAASVYPDRTAIIHGALRRSYAEFYARSRRLASALAQRGIGWGDTVAVMLANTPAMLECHYGVPMTGAVLNTLNTRLDAAVIAFSLDHAEAKVFIVDREFTKIAGPALAAAGVKPLVIDYDDPGDSGARRAPRRDRVRGLPGRGRPDFAWAMPRDEWDAIALNYTSGTTGDPKGVVYHHRGAYLLRIGNVVTRHGQAPGLSWTCRCSTATAGASRGRSRSSPGTHVCLRQVRAKAMFDALADHGVTHLAARPIVMSTLLNAPAARSARCPMWCSSSPPRPRRRGGARAMQEAGFDVTTSTA
jgi:fatty-acyl-CoA synthase